MLTRHIMSQPVAVCQLSDSLDQAARLMWEDDCGAVPVVDSAGRAVAMLTDRDICMAAYTQGKPLGQISVSSAMSKDLRACLPDDTLEQAEQLMMEYQLRRIPVLDDDGHPVGILSLNDLARAANHQHPAAPAGLDGVSLVTATRTMAAVCAPRLHAAGPRLS
ncbi:MAG TPA: CBS domain-containing protein [Pseudomonadota bacterium]|nr:CBS domain-containing protein [Pseudomonadota bacterium]